MVIVFVVCYDVVGKLICFICFVVVRVLGVYGLLKGCCYVCFGDLWKVVLEGVYVDVFVVEDGNLISGKGLGYVFDFVLIFFVRLLGDDVLVCE